ncbi:MAG: right-handed parallel beta-helix repeat-containing protein [Cyclobacteriaceae bacterium]
MKYIFLTILGLSALLFVFFSDSLIQSVSAEEKSAEYYDMSNLDIKVVEDVTPLVVKALEICKEEGYVGLKFPKGTYHFYPTYAPDFYAAITNNDNGLKRTPFPLFDFTDFHIDGGGSEFIFHGKMLPFIIEDSKKITLTDFSIDWEIPFFVQGTVTAVNDKTRTFDLNMETPYLVEDGALYLTAEQENSPFAEKFGHRFARQEKVHQKVGQNIIWDKNTGAPLYDHAKYSGFGRADFFEAQELEKGKVRLKGIYEKLPPVGTVFISKGEYLFNRQSPAFRVFKSEDLLFRNINIHHAGAMGLIAERSENITLDSFNVVLKEGSNRVVTTTADATHFCNCKGNIVIKNCTFENMLDDATNIHGTYARVKKVLNDKQVAFETYHPHQKDYLFAEKGDSVQVIHQKTLMPKSGVLVIENVKRINEKISVLTFDQSIEGLIEAYDGIDNLSWYASAHIENNTIRNNRARGFLISTSRKTVIRNNYISSQMAGILMTGDLNLWNESGPNRDLIIEENRFVNNAHGGNKQAVLQISPEQDLKGSQGETYYSSNIIIRNNIIETFDSPILMAKSVDGLVFQGNQIIQTDTYKPLFHGEPNLKIENSRGVLLEENTFKLLSGEYVQFTIDLDDQTTTLNNQTD